MTGIGVGIGLPFARRRPAQQQQAVVLLDTFTKPVPDNNLVPLAGKAPDIGISAWIQPPSINGIAVSDGFSWKHTASGGYSSGLLILSNFSSNDQTIHANTVPVPQRSFGDEAVITARIQNKNPTILWPEQSSGQTMMAFGVSDATGENGVAFGMLIVHGVSVQTYWLINEVIGGVAQAPALTPAGPFTNVGFADLALRISNGMFELDWNNGAATMQRPIDNIATACDTFFVMIDQTLSGPQSVSPSYPAVDKVEVFA